MMSRAFRIQIVERPDWSKIPVPGVSREHSTRLPDAGCYARNPPPEIEITIT